jgi:hemoglobin/transferrin/lactoferrin receptor protein
MKQRKIYYSLILCWFAIGATAQAVQTHWGLLLLPDAEGAAVDVKVTYRQHGTCTRTDSSGYFSCATNDLNWVQNITIQAPGWELVPDLSPQSDTVRVRLLPLPANTLSNVIIRASRQELAERQLPRTAALLTSRELRLRGERSLPDQLMGLGGVWVQKTNHGGGSVFLRGLTGQQTLLLLDGIRLNNAVYRSGPNQYLNTIDPVLVGQVEVLQGGTSVEYGSDAIGGAIQVRSTVTADERRGVHGHAGLGWATQGMEQSANASLNWRTGQLRTHFSGAARQFGDLHAGSGIGRQSPNGYDQYAYQGKTEWYSASWGHFTALWHEVRQAQVPVFHKIQLENFVINQFDVQNRQLGYLNWHYAPRSKHLPALRVTVGGQQNTEQRSSQKNNNPILTRENDRVQGWFALAEAVTKRQLGSNLNWQGTYGAECYHDMVRSTKSRMNAELQTQEQLRGLYPDRSTMRQTALFTLHRFHWSQWQFTGGLRWNLTQLHLNETTLGKVALSPSALVGNFSVGYTHRSTFFYGHYNTAFRAPNIDDLGTLGIVDFRYEIPNTALRPEQARTFELGVKHNTDAFACGLSVAYVQLSNLIGRTKTTDSIQGYAVYLKENIGRSFIYTLQAQMAWRLHPAWRLQAHYSYTYGQNTSANEPMRRTPPMFGRVQLNWLPGAGMQVTAEWMAAGAQRRLAQGDIDDNRIADDGTPAWGVGNLHLSAEWRNCLLTATFQNVTNRAYRVHGSGVDGLGRSLWLRTQFFF